MNGLKTVLLTSGVVFAGLSITATVLVIVWLIGNYSVDRLLQIVSIVVGVVGFLFTLAISFRSRR